MNKDLKRDLGGAPVPVTAAPDLSVVVPMYNEEEVIGAFFARLRPVLDGLGLSYEIICVNDGSRDRTFLLLQQNLHLVHHLWPSVPFYNYAKLFHRLRPVLRGEGSRIEGLMVGPRRRAIIDQG